MSIMAAAGFQNIIDRMTLTTKAIGEMVLEPFHLQRTGKPAEQGQHVLEKQLVYCLMPPTIIIGKTSDDRQLKLPLSELPHLFICYSEKKQLADYLNTSGLLNDKNVQFSIASGSDFFNYIAPVAAGMDIRNRFIKSSIDSQAGTKAGFLQQLIRELKQRKKQPTPTPHVIIMDDILDFVITPKKQTGEQLLQLLKEGPACGMHVIAASIRTYQNLVRQLNTFSAKHDEAITRSAAELIINPDDLFFFRERTAEEYTRYFYVKEGVRELAVENLFK